MVLCIGSDGGAPSWGSEFLLPVVSIASSSVTSTSASGSSFFGFILLPFFLNNVPHLPFFLEPPGDAAGLSSATINIPGYLLSCTWYDPLFSVIYN